MKHAIQLFPRRIGQSGYNKRVRKSFFLFIWVIRVLAADTSLWSDDVRVVDSTPVQCGCSRETVTRSDAAGWAEYGYCASHSRYFRGLRLHLVCTLHGLPVMFALAGAKAGEREVLPGMLENAAGIVNASPGQTLSVNWTLKGQLDLEQHGGRTPEGIMARVLTRILALTAAIWHNDKTSQNVMRSLTAFPS